LLILVRICSVCAVRATPQSSGGDYNSCVAATSILRFFKELSAVTLRLNGRPEPPSSVSVPFHSFRLPGGKTVVDTQVSLDGSTALGEVRPFSAPPFRGEEASFEATQPSPGPGCPIPARRKGPRCPPGRGRLRRSDPTPPRIPTDNYRLTPAVRPIFRRSSESHAAEPPR
jgi:hypothetical protein